MDIKTKIVRETIGSPFRHQGRTIADGLDCAGVIVHLFKSLNLDFIDAVGYERNPSQSIVKTALENQSFIKKVSTPKEGDIFLMRIAREPQHLAYFTGDTIIHSFKSVGRVVEHRLDDRWSKRICGIYRINDEQ